MQATVTLSGSFEEIAQAIETLKLNATGQSLQQESGVNVERFLNLLSDQARLAVFELASASSQGYTHTRSLWQKNIEVESTDVFNGVLGTIGRAWAKVSSDPNPFVSRGTDSNGEPLYRIRDKDLLRQINEIQEEWAGNL